MKLPLEVTRELDDLERRLGPTRTLEAAIDDSFKDPIWKRDRYGEVCMVIRRRSGKIPLSIKTFYPRGAYRLPTGGIPLGEGVYEAADKVMTRAHRFIRESGGHPVGRRHLEVKAGSAGGQVASSEQVDLGASNPDKREVPATLMDQHRTGNAQVELLGSLDVLHEWRGHGRPSRHPDDWLRPAARDLRAPDQRSRSG